MRIGLCQSDQVLQCWRGQWKHLTGWDQTYHSCCPLPSLTQCGVVTMIKTADHQIHIYWETEHFVHALWFVIIWVSSVPPSTIRRRLHISIRNKKVRGRATSVPTWLPRRGLAGSLSVMWQPDRKVWWKSRLAGDCEEFQWNSLQASSR